MPWSRTWTVLSIALALGLALGCSQPSRRAGGEPPPRAELPAPAGFAAPAMLFADGVPIDTEIGHAAPFLCDWDGDGDRDLLVGQFGDGKLKIHRNSGTDRAPRYDAPVWFEAGGELATVPAG